MTRILWVGCHKLLVCTELVELRNLGYEVYRPQYLSNIYDQSAITEKDANPSTLPKDILEILDKTNFFYADLTSEVEQIINEYFDVCVVTISPSWLKSLVRSFKGKVVYRTYGQPYLLSIEFETIDLTSQLINRKNFYFLPHALDSLESEHTWLKQRAIEVPYWIDQDVFEIESSWSPESSQRKIGLLCPNVENPYYLSHYRYLKRDFRKSFYRIFGVQKSIPQEKWIVGTLEREHLLKEFQSLAGFQYTYSEKNTCYLPPIEAAVIGVPILYPKGSLLSKYIGAGGPGEWETEQQADRLARRLLNKDMNLINDILKAQSKVKDLYRRESCLTTFEETFRSIIEENMHEDSAQRNSVIVPFFFPGNLIDFDGVSYSAAEGIPRVIKFYLETLLDEGYSVTILVFKHQIANTWGFFNQDRSVGLAEIIPIDSSSEFNKLLMQLSRRIRPLRDKLPMKIQTFLRQRLNFIQSKLRNVINSKVIESIIVPAEIPVLLVPHYYHFRTLFKLDLDVSIILYLPDYIPHLFPSNFKEEIRLYEKDGIKIAQQARLVITNSLSTQRYLPDSALSVDPSKIRVFPLPRLGSDALPKKVLALHQKLFLFYPTQFRPNKRIDLLLTAFDKVATSFDISLVLTGSFAADPKSKAIYESMANRSKVILLGMVSDAELNWLYMNCEAVVVTSESEGNFPTQLTEAIYHAKPFIAANIDVVLEELSAVEGMNLFENGSPQDLELKIQHVLKNLRLEEVKMFNLRKNYSNLRLSEAKIGILEALKEALGESKKVDR